MAVPSSPSVASRGLYFPAAPSAPAVAYVTPSGHTIYTPPGNVVPDLAGGPLPCLCVSVGGAALDYLRSIWLVFGPSGEAVVRTDVISTTTWTAHGLAGGRRPLAAGRHGDIGDNRMRYDPPVARCAAAYRIIGLARAAIARGDNKAAAAFFRSSTAVLLGEEPAAPEPPLDPETSRRREISRSYAKIIAVGFGVTKH